AAKGRSDLHLRIEIYKKAVSLIILVSLMFAYGLIGIVVASALSMIVHFLFNSYFCAREISYSILNQIFSFIPSLTLSLLLAFLSYILFLEMIFDVKFLLLLVLLYFVAYIMLSMIIKIVEIQELKKLIKN